MTDYDYGDYCEVMKQALKTMDELLDSFETHNEKVGSDKEVNDVFNS